MDLFRRGLRVDRSTGGLRVRGPASVLAEFRAEVARRAALFAALLPARRPYVPLRIVAGERGGRMAYYGACEHCDEELSRHRGGCCPLCEAALRAATGVSTTTRRDHDDASEPATIERAPGGDRGPGAP